MLTEAERVRNLQVPTGIVDAILDTDTFNEIDDQFAVTYFLRAPERIRPLAVTAAPFHNARSSGPADGMEQSYAELGRLLALLGREDVPRYRGAARFMTSENDPVCSEAAETIVRLAAAHTKEDPLYVIAIGAITNVASAVLLDPSIVDRVVIVWLGGNSREWKDTHEFNMFQDIPAARVVMTCGAPFVHLPCAGVVDAFTVSPDELKTWLVGKNPVADYLARATLDYCAWRNGTPWTKVIWDVTAVAWLLNDGDRFMTGRLLPSVAPTEKFLYETNAHAPLCRYMTHINRDALMADLFARVLR